MSIFPERWMGRGVPTDKLPKYYTMDGKKYNTRTNEEVPKKKRIMKQFVLRHVRGNGQIIADIMKDFYHDYPKHRNMRPYKLSECIHQVLSQKEYLEYVKNKYGIEEHNRMVIKHKLGNWNLIEEKEA